MADELIGARVRISDPQHPHFGASGNFTGYTIFVAGKPMTKVDAAKRER